MRGDTDPELTVGLPRDITAHTAMDALTHALEAYTNTYANSETDRFAEIAVKLIYENVVNVYNNPKDIKGREALLWRLFMRGWHLHGLMWDMSMHLHIISADISMSPWVGLCCASSCDEIL